MEKAFVWNRFRSVWTTVNLPAAALQAGSGSTMDFPRAPVAQGSARGSVLPNTQINLSDVVCDIAPPCKRPRLNATAPGAPNHHGEWCSLAAPAASTPPATTAALASPAAGCDPLPRTASAMRPPSPTPVAMPAAQSGDVPALGPLGSSQFERATAMAGVAAASQAMAAAGLQLPPLPVPWPAQAAGVAAAGIAAAAGVLQARHHPARGRVTPPPTAEQPIIL